MCNYLVNYRRWKMRGGPGYTLQFVRAEDNQLSPHFVRAVQDLLGGLISVLDQKVRSTPQLGVLRHKSAKFLFVCLGDLLLRTRLTVMALRRKNRLHH